MRDGTKLVVESAMTTVRYMRAAGSQREIGQALAAAAEEAHGAAARPAPIDSDLERARRRWFTLHHPILVERSRGVADHHGLDPDDPTVALDAMGTQPGMFGCSAAVLPGSGTVDGHTLLARNFDFPTSTLTEFLGLPPLPGERPAVADPWVVELRPDGGPASVTIGFGDVMGAMDGINEAGLAVSLLADDVNLGADPALALQVGLSEFQVVRYVLDTCTTVAEAIEALRVAKHYYLGLPCHYVVADSNGDSFVWEHSRLRNREIVVTPPGGGRTVCTNHLLHQWPDATDLDDDDNGPMGAATQTFRRWRALDEATRHDRPMSRDQVREDLADLRFIGPSPEPARTIWQSLYDLDAPSIEVTFLTDDDPTSTYSHPLTYTLR